MKFALLIYEDEKRLAGMDQAGWGAEMAEYRAFGQQAAGAIRGGEALEPTGKARTVRVQNGKTLSTDGPFAETKEQLGGFYIVEAGDANEAAALAAKIPAAKHGSIEVRPVMKVS